MVSRARSGPRAVLPMPALNILVKEYENVTARVVFKLMLISQVFFII